MIEKFYDRCKVFVWVFCLDCGLYFGSFFLREKIIDGLKIEWTWSILSIHKHTATEFVFLPADEFVYIVVHIFIVCVKDMRPILLYEDSVCIFVIIHVSACMISAFYDEDCLSFFCQFTRNNGACQTAAYYKNVKICHKYFLLIFL